MAATKKPQTKSEKPQAPTITTPEGLKAELIKSGFDTEVWHDGNTQLTYASVTKEKVKNEQGDEYTHRRLLSIDPAALSQSERAKDFFHQLTTTL